MNAYIYTEKVCYFLLIELFSSYIQHCMFSLIITVKTSTSISTGHDPTLTAINRNSLKLIPEYIHNLLFGLKLNEDKKSSMLVMHNDYSYGLFKLPTLSLLYSDEIVHSDIGVRIMRISLRN